ncbi:MAG: hypothetical protein WCV00_16830 [Verrucomicrobiia bacterium]|jgi:hypothetical protein
MNLRNPQFFTLNSSLLTSLSRTLLLLAMAWAAAASAADGEGKWKQLLDTKLVDEWQPIFIDAYVDPEHGRPPRPAETLAQKMIAFNKVIAKSTGGQTVPIYLSPEAATVQYPKQEKPRGVQIMIAIVSVSLRDTLRYVTDISGVRFKITDEGILIFVPPKPAKK